MSRIVYGGGPSDAKIMIVGEAPGFDDERIGQPFVGASGTELTKMLHEAGIVRSECFMTHVCLHRPPSGDIDTFRWMKKSGAPSDFVWCNGRMVHHHLADGVAQLWRDIERINPQMLIACGNIALWALTNGEQESASDWRGSQLFTSTGHRFVPTYHPITVMKQWAWRNIMVTDLRRAKGWMESGATEPPYNFTIRPNFAAVMSTLSALLNKAKRGRLKLAVDIETRMNQIACVGLAWSTLDAICIPILCVERDDGYWSFEEEVAIIKTLAWLLSHPNVENVGQNYIYDVQYFFRCYGIIPNTRNDTMVMQHVAFAGMSKGLDFLSSMYCTWHRYWKGEGKLWDPKTTSEDQLWTYNCKDAVITYEVSSNLAGVLEQLNLTQQYTTRMRYWWTILLMTLRGVAVDNTARGALARELMEVNTTLNARIVKIVGHPINIKSPKQLAEFFYGEMNLAPVMNRKTKRVSTDFESLKKLGDKEPIILPIIDVLLTLRSIGVFVSTFLSSSLDVDGRMRCSFNVAGPETYRLSSSQNPFGSGMNLQNIPSGDRKSLLIKMPNVRKTFIPDRNHTIFDIDLDRADLQVVVWEADDTDLKRQLRLGVDLHVMNGVLLAGKEPPPEDELIESHPNYPEHKARYKKERQLAKNFVHGTNYGGKEKTMAAVCGITVAACAALQKRWFSLHPGIAKWHERVERNLQTRRFVENAFGYRRYYFDRIDTILPEALAWIPQSTVAEITAQMQTNIEFNLPDVQLLIQVHDSLVGQYLTHKEHLILPSLHSACLITVPYPDPLIIPVGLKTSTKSWGDCEEHKWPAANLITG